MATKNVGEGTIAFIGETTFAKGEWIGIILDEKKGKNNGSIQGKEYFSCEHEYGMFVRSSLIQLIGSARSSGAATPAKTRLTRKSIAKPSESKATPRSRSSSQNRSKITSGRASRDQSPAQKEREETEAAKEALQS